MDEPSNFALKLQEWIDMDRAEFERLTLGLPPDVAFQTLLLLLLNLYRASSKAHLFQGWDVALAALAAVTLSLAPQCTSE